MPVIKLNDIRKNNILRILRILLEEEEISRIELATRCGCDNTTVTRAIRELLARKVIENSGKREQPHGRPRELLRLDPTGCPLVGIALESDGVAGVVTDLRGAVRSRERISWRAPGSRKEFREALERIVRNQVAFAKGRVGGIGVAAFGAFDRNYLVHNAASFPELNGVSLREELYRCTGGMEPEIADMLMARITFELARHPESSRGTLLLVYGGRSGLGIATAFDGRLPAEAKRRSGEFGHNIIEMNGLPCRCGRRGCLETRFSRNALPGDFSVLRQRYRDGDAGACRTVDDAAAYFVAALVNQINNLLPDRVVLTGSLMEFGSDFEQKIRDGLKELLFPAAEEGLQLDFRVDSETEPAAVGAALLAARKIMTDFDAFDAACPAR